ncbi:hypothetical protein [Tabrizicola sp. BL-A-41-H6]|uniref:hypothetical protein n=1 Tax=Tabrizicola sp. BL-A-41-H6 TaxID=3421107 RepID=UPI003D676EE9
MGKNGSSRASDKDVSRRFKARGWLTEAIRRGMDLGIDVAPAMDLLEALENLDYVEVVENYGTELEEVVSSRSDGPANIQLQPGQVLRLAGHVDPILKLPADGPRTVSNVKGGIKLTPAQESRHARSIAFVDSLVDLGMSVATATKRVEDYLGPVANLRKKFNSRGYSVLEQEYADHRALLHGKSDNEVFALIVKAALPERK